MISGHHVSKKSWTPYIDEELSLSCEVGNVYDKRAVAVRKDDAVVVVHAPRKMSRVFWFFLQHGGADKSLFFAPQQQ